MSAKAKTKQEREGYTNSERQAPRASRDSVNIFVDPTATTLPSLCGNFGQYTFESISALVRCVRGRRADHNTDTRCTEDTGTGSAPALGELPSSRRGWEEARMMMTNYAHED